MPPAPKETNEILKTPTRLQYLENTPKENPPSYGAVSWKENTDQEFHGVFCYIRIDHRILLEIIRYSLASLKGTHDSYTY